MSSVFKEKVLPLTDNVISKMKLIPYYDQLSQPIEELLKPYNLPFNADQLILVLVSLLVLIFVSAIFGNSNGHRGSRGSSNRGSTSAGKKSVKRGKNIVILGLQGSGKTSLFSKLSNIQKLLQSYTSMSVNSGNYQTENGKKLVLIDVPGNSKMKSLLPKILDQAGCIIYLIDNSQFDEQAQLEASNLYDILTIHEVNEKRIPILFYLNKMDLDSSNDASHIQQVLESEIDDLRTTRGSTPVVLNQEDDRKEIILGVEGTPFQFDQLPQDIKFAHGTVTATGENEVESLQPIRDFISETLLK
ncbi:signal recognition particle receptor beta subunit [Tieghemostelium lacteum]|uniref:Signal recognition particle receptor subunit beta n=1 Tax=Tieghemostelium lacteum TaxID=361077 RepID=A0A151ZBA4_TIELA|nr:signal recognition particle receptor beta subunit [Tieghemostelium lacteum]|eukprot:KYQ91216.1 signal recognition particle receptor beta subunit [Tieghemostelium lacteum]